MPYSKKGGGNRHHNNPVDDAKLYKTTTKKRDQFDPVHAIRWNQYQYYNSLENTEHSYQIVQGDLGLRLLQN
jgi:DNA polymerase-1